MQLRTFFFLMLANEEEVERKTAPVTASELSGVSVFIFGCLNTLLFLSWHAAFFFFVVVIIVAVVRCYWIRTEERMSWCLEFDCVNGLYYCSYCCCFHILIARICFVVALHVDPDRKKKKTGM